MPSGAQLAMCVRLRRVFEPSRGELRRDGSVVWRGGIRRVYRRGRKGRRGRAGHILTEERSDYLGRWVAKYRSMAAVTCWMPARTLRRRRARGASNFPLTNYFHLDIIHHDVEYLAMFDDYTLGGTPVAGPEGFAPPRKRQGYRFFEVPPSGEAKGRRNL